MKSRPLVATVAAVAALLIAVSGAVAWAVATVPDGRSGMAPMMSGRGPTEAGPNGMSGWMHQTRLPGEFTYLTVMIAHHEEAVAAAAELRRSPRAELRFFGGSIVATQSAQIKDMRAWLGRWYPGRSTAVDYWPMMRDMSGLDGDALDRTFMQDMIGHHMAAVMMSQQLLMADAAEHPETKDLAARIRDEQHQEMFQMRTWLADWFDVLPRGGRHWGRMMW